MNGDGSPVARASFVEELDSGSWPNIYSQQKIITLENVKPESRTSAKE